MKKVSEMNGNERKALHVIRSIFNYEVTGWYNAYTDGWEEDIPETEDEARAYIYSEASLRAPKEIRFAGKAFALEVIDRLFKRDYDVAEIAEAKGWR